MSGSPRVVASPYLGSFSGFFMSMTAAEALRSAEPPVDDGGIDQALAELDVKIWTWTDAMLSARAAIKRSLAHREIFSRGGEYSIGAGAAQPPVAKPLIARNAPPFGQSFADVAPPEAAPAFVAPAPSFNAAEPDRAFGAAWGRHTPAENVSLPGQVQQPAGPAANSDAVPSANGGWAPTGAMQWPSTDSSTSASNAAEITPLAWPSPASDGASAWPTSESSGADAASTTASSSKTLGRMPERTKKTAPPRISPEETEARAARAAHEEALLAALNETSARRVRLLRRLDPDADIEQLIEKANQAQSRESEKIDKSSSWWRRK